MEGRSILDLEGFLGWFKGGSLSPIYRGTAKILFNLSIYNR